MSNREGPLVRIDASCFGCAHVHTEHYRVQGDSGCDVSCGHADVQSGDTRVGDTSWTTPAWCPLLTVAVDRLIRERKP